MPIVQVKLATPVQRSFRVEQVAGMLDVPVTDRLRHELKAELPGLDEPWQIGAIVGPSGSGKTTLARAAYGTSLYQAQPWPRGRAIVDCLGNCMADRNVCPTIKDIARVLTSVGLGSVPTWLKPYSVLSTGEQFRANLARGVLGVRDSGFGVRGQEPVQRDRATPLSPDSRTPSPLLVFDEFTSSLDRLIAKTTSAALGRFIRRADSRVCFVAVTCHKDILPWLAPDL